MNTESQLVVLLQLKDQRVEILTQNPTHFEIWIQNPWYVWNLNPESLNSPSQAH